MPQLRQTFWTPRDNRKLWQQSQPRTGECFLEANDGGDENVDIARFNLLDGANIEVN